MDRQRFQGVCLVSDEGWKHMSIFDGLPSPVREQLKVSSFNLCPCCVVEIAERHARFDNRCLARPVDYDRAIRDMETLVRGDE